MPLIARGIVRLDALDVYGVNRQRGTRAPRPSNDGLRGKNMRKTGFLRVASRRREHFTGAAHSRQNLTTRFAGFAKAALLTAGLVYAPSLTGVGVTPAQAQTQPTFGACSSAMYLGQNSPTRLFQFDTSQNPFLVEPVGPNSGITYNAIAMHPTNGYI